MAIEKKKTPAVKPVVKPVVNNHHYYVADKALLPVLLLALVSVILYYAFMGYLNAPTSVKTVEVPPEIKVRVISGGVVKDVAVPKTPAVPWPQPDPRHQR